MIFNVNSFMQAPVYTVPADASVQDAARVMREHAVGQLVLVEDGRVAGLVTLADLVGRALAVGKAPGTPVAEIATRHVVTCRPEHSVADAKALLEGHGLKRLVVVDGEDHPLGTFSTDGLALLRKDEGWHGVLAAGVEELRNRA